MALRTVACLPALTGAWRDAAGGVLLSTSGNYPVDSAALERPDLMPTPTPRTINMSTIGHDLLHARPPIKALFVYNSNPVAVAPQSGRGGARLRPRRPVHRCPRSLPDRHRRLRRHPPAGDQPHGAARHPQVVRAPASPGQSAGDRAARRGAAEHRAVPPAGPADGLSAKRVLPTSDDDLCRQAFDWSDPRLAGLSWEKLKADGHARLNLPRGAGAVRRRRLPDAFGQMRVLQPGAGRAGDRPPADFIAPREWRQSPLATEFPLALITPPARNFLNTSFANSPRFLAQEKSPAVHLNPADAAARGIADDSPVRIFNRSRRVPGPGRGHRPRPPGVAMATSIWWRKLSPDGRNCNEVTSQALVDRHGRRASQADVLRLPGRDQQPELNQVGADLMIDHHQRRLAARFGPGADSLTDMAVG
jgi:hypothetical protein